MRDRAEEEEEEQKKNCPIIPIWRNDGQEEERKREMSVTGLGHQIMIARVPPLDSPRSSAQRDDSQGLLLPTIRDLGVVT